MSLAPMPSSRSLYLIKFKSVVMINIINNEGKELIMKSGLYLYGISNEEYAKDRLMVSNIEINLSRGLLISARPLKNSAMGAASNERV
jgi:hypothetical protein